MKKISKLKNRIAKLIHKKREHSENLRETELSPANRKPKTLMLWTQLTDTQIHAPSLSLHLV